MKINIANPTTGCQKLFDIDDDKKLRIFFDKRISQDVDASPLGDNFKGYVLRITGGNDKQGFGMKQGILFNGRIRVLLSPYTTCFRRTDRPGERKRRTVRGCIAGPDLAVINTIIVKKGPQEIEGLTDKTIPRRLGPKRASKIRKLFNLTKTDDVRKYVIRRTVTLKKEKDGKKTRTKAPKIQRLVTSLTIQRKHHRLAEKKKNFARVNSERAAYVEMLKTRRADAKKKLREEKLKAREAKSAARAAVLKRKNMKILKNMTKHEEYAEKVKSRISSRKLTPKQRKEARKLRKTISENRAKTLKALIAMRGVAKKRLLKAREQLKTDHSAEAHRVARRFKREAHELYLRIMSGARLPNLKRQDRLLKELKVTRAKAAERKVAKHFAKARKERALKIKAAATLKAKFAQPAAKKAKTN